MKDAAIAALRTAAISFVGLFSVSALDWLNKASEWFKAGGPKGSQPFPDVSVLGYAAGAAALASVIGLLNLAVIVIQQKSGKGRTPSY